MGINVRDLPAGKKFIADLTVILIMLGILSLAAYACDIPIEPAIGQKKSGDIFVFLVAIPAILGGAAIGKYLVNRHMVSKWSVKNDKKL